MKTSPMQTSVQELWVSLGLDIATAARVPECLTPQKFFSHDWDCILEEDILKRLEQLGRRVGAFRLSKSDLEKLTREAEREREAAQAEYEYEQWQRLFIVSEAHEANQSYMLVPGGDEDNNLHYNPVYDQYVPSVPHWEGSSQCKGQAKGAWTRHKCAQSLSKIAKTFFEMWS